MGEGEDSALHDAAPGFFSAVSGAILMIDTGDSALHDAAPGFFSAVSGAILMIDTGCLRWWRKAAPLLV